MYIYVESIPYGRNTDENGQHCVCDQNYVYIFLLPPNLTYQSTHMDETLHPPTVGQTWREGENQGIND